MFDSLDELAKRRAERKQKRKQEEEGQKHKWLDSSRYELPDTPEQEDYQKVAAESMYKRRKLRKGISDE